MERKNSLYSDSGVNIDLGDKASKMLYEASKQTWKNREGLIGEIITPFDDFSGLRGVDVSKLPEGTIMGMGFDGVGTKIEISERVGKFDTIGFDLLAMVCDDAVVRGAEPVIAGSILDVNTLGSKENSFIDNIKSLADGYVKAANSANVALINGELAELGSSISGYGEFNYSWGASVVWFANKDRMLKGDKIEVGQKIIALSEVGFRSNGLSLVRKVLQDNYGDLWHNEKYLNSSLGSLVLQPSKIYCKEVSKLFGGLYDHPIANLSGVCHITGGGIPGKLGRVLKSKRLGAVLNNLFEVPDIIKHVQSLGNVSDEEAYKTWCMGQGMFVITDSADIVIDFFSKSDIKSQIVGEVIEEPKIILNSQGNFSRGKEIIFDYL